VKAVRLPGDLCAAIRLASRGRVVTWLVEAVARQWLYDLGSELARDADATDVLSRLLRDFKSDIRGSGGYKRQRSDGGST